MSKEIKLTKGMSAIVDDDDFEKLNQYKWHYMNVGYAGRDSLKSCGPKRKIYMHREIVTATNGYEVDHINRNKLDNRKINLRVVTKHENRLNKSKRSDNTSGYIGVYWVTRISRWVGKVQLAKRVYTTRYYKNIEDAIREREGLVVKLHKKFAVKNI